LGISCAPTVAALESNMTSMKVSFEAFNVLWGRDGPV
jgi:hypothetical protein